MINKIPFDIDKALNEKIYFEFEDDVKAISYLNSKEAVTLRNFIDRNMDDTKIFPQYAKLKQENAELLAEIQRLKEKLEPFEKNKGKGRRKGTYKLNDKQIQEVFELHKKGLPNTKIAKQFKVNEKTIRNILKRELNGK